MSNPFKRGAAVRFFTRSRRGTGKIKAVRETGRGLWYDVQTEDKEVISVRVSALTAL